MPTSLCHRYIYTIFFCNIYQQNAVVIITYFYSMIQFSGCTHSVDSLLAAYVCHK